MSISALAILATSWLTKHSFVSLVSIAIIAITVGWFGRTTFESSEIYSQTQANAEDIEDIKEHGHPDMQTAISANADAIKEVLDVAKDVQERQKRVLCILQDRPASECVD